MSAKQTVSEPYQINIYRDGELSGIMEGVTAEKVEKISTVIKESEDDMGRKDSRVEFQKEDKPEKKGWFKW